MFEGLKGIWRAIEKGMESAFTEVKAENMAGPRQWMIDEINRGTYDGFPRHGTDKVKYRAALIAQVQRGEFDAELRKLLIQRKR